jgi:hypothetical protein
MNPGQNGTVDQFGSSTITAFPYSWTNFATGVASVIAQAFGRNDATTLAVQAIALAAQDPGLINIRAFSGGEQAFNAAISLLLADIVGRINNVTYLSPGSFRSQLASGSGITTFISGTSLIDVAINGNAPYGAHWGRTKCGNLGCETKENLTLLKSLEGNPCSNPTRAKPQRGRKRWGRVWAGAGTIQRQRQATRSCREGVLPPDPTAQVTSTITYQ